MANFLYEAFNFFKKSEALFIFVIFQLKMRLIKFIMIIEFYQNLEEKKYFGFVHFIDNHNYFQYFGGNEYFLLLIDFINFASFTPQNWDALLLNC
jgi:hypothetical protein